MIVFPSATDSSLANVATLVSASSGTSAKSGVFFNELTSTGLFRRLVDGNLTDQRFAARKDRGEKPLDRLDHAGRAHRGEHVEGVLGPRELRVHDGLAGDRL